MKQKVIVFPGRTARRSSTGSIGRKDLLSGVKSIPGDDNNDGLIVMSNGGTRKIIKCDGLNLYLLNDAQRAEFGEQLAELVGSLKFAIQILAISCEANPDNECSNYQKASTEVEYLKWFDDYLRKWRQRVADVHFISKRDFYVIVCFDQKIVRSSKINSKLSTKLKHGQEIFSIDEQCTLVLNHLKRAGLNPHILKRNELRALLHQQL